MRSDLIYYSNSYLEHGFICHHVHFLLCCDWWVIVCFDWIEFPLHSDVRLWCVVNTTMEIDCIIDVARNNLVILSLIFLQKGWAISTIPKLHCSRRVARISHIKSMLFFLWCSVLSEHLSVKKTLLIRNVLWGKSSKTLSQIAIQYKPMDMSQKSSNNR